MQATQDRCTELEAEKAQMGASLQEAVEKLEARESRLAEVLEGRAKLRKQLDQGHAEFSAMQASLKAELAAVQARYLQQIMSRFMRVSIELFEKVQHAVFSSSSLLPSTNYEGKLVMVPLPFESSSILAADTMIGRGS